MREIEYAVDFNASPARTKFTIKVPIYGGTAAKAFVRDAKSRNPFFLFDGARHDLTEEEKKYIYSVLDEVKKVSANQNRKGDGICSKSLTRV